MILANKRFIAAWDEYVAAWESALGAQAQGHDSDEWAETLARLNEQAETIAESLEATYEKYKTADLPLSSVVGGSGIPVEESVTFHPQVESSRRPCRRAAPATPAARAAPGPTGCSHPAPPLLCQHPFYYAEGGVLLSSSAVSRRFSSRIKYLVQAGSTPSEPPGKSV